MGKKYLKSMLAIILSVTLFGNTFSEMAYATEDSEDNESSSSDESSEDNWVGNKDEFRHYEVDDWYLDDYSLGQAEGECARELNDGKWYWYHQRAGGCGCPNCGDWSGMLWGAKGDMSHTFGVDGCAMYSLSMIMSNLTNKEINPIVWLTSLGCTIDANHKTCNTSTSKCFNGRCFAALDNIWNVVKGTYELEVEPVDMSSLSSFQAGIDKALDNFGMVWYCFHAGGASYPFPPFGTSMHFICIRSHKGSDYYLLDSCVPNDDQLNTPVSIETLYNHRNMFVYGITNPNPPQRKVKGAGGKFQSNGDWFTDGKSVGKYKNKTLLANDVYLYDGLPWEPDSNTYIGDTDAMLIDLVKYVEENSTTGDVPTTYTGKKFDPETILSNSRMINDTSVDCNNAPRLFNHESPFTNVGGGQVAKIDGVTTLGVCIPPVLIDCNYNDGFGNYKKDGNTEINYWMNEPTPPLKSYSYGHKKMAIVLKEKNGSAVYYLPATNCDAKGHTFPGGIAQTGLKLTGKAKLGSKGEVQSFGAVQRALNNSGYSYDTTSGLKVGELCKFMNTRVISSSNVSAWDCINNIAEFWHVPPSVYSKISNNYRVIGVAVWGDT